MALNISETLPQKTREFYKNAKVVVTGGLGFIGSNLAHALVALGSRVIIVDALIPEHGGNPFNVRDIRDAIEVHRFNVCERHRLKPLIESTAVVFNLAGQVSHIDSLHAPERDIQHNLLAPLAALEACRELNRDARVLFAGTRGQYGRPASLPVAEDAPMIPVDPNGVNKIAGEMYHLLYWRLYGIPTTSLRLTNTYGPRLQVRSPRQGFLGWFLRLALDGQTIQLYGSGRQLRDFTHVDDVVRAFLLAGASKVAAGKAYNLGSGQPVSVREMAERLVRVAGSGKFETIPYPPDKKAIEIGDYVADWSRIRNDLGWEPLVSLEQGLRETIEFYRRNKEYYW